MQALPITPGMSRAEYGGITATFARNADAGMHTSAGWALYSSAAGVPRTRQVAVANAADPISHGAELSAKGFAPAFVKGGLLYGCPNDSGQQWYSMDSAGSFTANKFFITPAPENANQDFRAAVLCGGRVLMLMNNSAGAKQGLNLFASDVGYPDVNIDGSGGGSARVGGGSLHPITLDGGISVVASPTEVSGGAQIAAWGSDYDATTDECWFTIYAAGNTVGSCDSIWRIPNFTTANIDGLTAYRVFQHAVKESGSADDSNEHLHAMALHHGLNIRVQDCGDGYGGTLDANGRIKGQRTLVARNGGTTFANLTGTAADHSPGGQITMYDDYYRDPTRIFGSGDASFDAGWQQLVSPYRVGSVLRDQIGWDWSGKPVTGTISGSASTGTVTVSAGHSLANGPGILSWSSGTSWAAVTISGVVSSSTTAITVTGTGLPTSGSVTLANGWPGHTTSVVLGANTTWMVNGVRILIVPNNAASPTGSFAIYLIDPTTGERVLYAIHSAGGFDRYAGVFGGRMQFSVYESGVKVRWSVAVPKLTHVAGTVYGARQVNLLDDTRCGAGNGAKIAKCNDATAFTASSANVALSNDTGSVYVQGETQSLRVVQTAAVPTGATRMTPEGAYYQVSSLTVGASYVFRFAARVRKGKYLAVAITTASGGSLGSVFQRYTPLYDSAAWKQFQTAPYVATATSVYIRMYVYPDEISGEIDANFGCNGLFRLGGTAPYTNQGHAREWVYGTGGGERSNLVITTPPATFSHVFAIKCECELGEMAGDVYVVSRLSGGEDRVIWYDPSVTRWKMSADDGSGGPTGSATNISGTTTCAPRLGRVLVFVISSVNDGATPTTRLAARVFAMDEAKASSFMLKPYAIYNQSSPTDATSVNISHGYTTAATNDKSVPLPGMILLASVFCDFVPGDGDVNSWLSNGDVGAWAATLRSRRAMAVLD